MVGIDVNIDKLLKFEKNYYGGDPYRITNGYINGLIKLAIDKESGVGNVIRGINEKRNGITTDTNKLTNKENSCAKVAEPTKKELIKLELPCSKENLSDASKDIQTNFFAKRHECETIYNTLSSTCTTNVTSKYCKTINTKKKEFEDTITKAHKAYQNKQVEILNILYPIADLYKELKAFYDKLIKCTTDSSDINSFLNLDCANNSTSIDAAELVSKLNTLNLTTSQDKIKRLEAEATKLLSSLNDEKGKLNEALNKITADFKKELDECYSKGYEEKYIPKVNDAKKIIEDFKNSIKANKEECGKEEEKKPVDDTATKVSNEAAKKSAETGQAVGLVKSGGEDISSPAEKEAQNFLKSKANITGKSSGEGTYTAVVNPGSPVGLGQVVWMDYIIGYGKFDLGMENWLAYRTSFQEGVSLSSIQWSFVNTGTQKGNEITGKISFTLHDIAGALFEKYMHIKTGIDYLYFVGPKSDGNLWDSGLPSLYQVDPEGCSLEFSATQGFTYTIAGISAVSTSKSTQISAPADFGITGVIGGTNQTFIETVVVELVSQWNKKVMDTCKTGAQIELILDGSKEKNAIYMVRPPVTIDKKNGGENDNTFNFSVKMNESLHDIITRLWTEIFQNTDDTNPNNDVKKNVRVRVDFEKWEGNKITCQILFTDDTADTVLTNPMKICVGDDKNCEGAPYRGELASINLNDIVNKFLIHEGFQGTEANGTAPSGSEVKPPVPNCVTEKIKTYPNDHGTASESNMDWKASGFLKSPEGGAASGYWGQVFRLIKDNNATPLEIEINMSYTSDFTPDIHTGKLKTGIQGMASTIDLTQGAELEFYWYSNPNCDSLVLSPVISSSYRISEVSHQIGLSGNQTVVKLSHLQL